MPRKRSLGVSSRSLVMPRGDVRLAADDYGGRGPAVLLVHGLAGQGGEWSQTAWWLTDRGRVVAVDVRGHGESERRPTDLSSDALVDDLVHIIEVLRLAPVVVVGQSLGGVVALLLAARRPDLVRGLVMVEAAPTDGFRKEAEAEAERMSVALRSWPVPFATLQDALDFFTERHGSREVGFQWAVAMEQRDDGFWPPFDVEVVIELLRGVLARPTWADWAAVRCPTLVVRATWGSLSAATAARMQAALPTSQVVAVEAAHDVHLDAPGEWRRVLTRFLDRIDADQRS